MIRNFGSVNVESFFSRDSTFDTLGDVRADSLSLVVDDEQFSEGVRIVSRAEGNLPLRSVEASRANQRPIDVDRDSTDDGPGYTILGVPDHTADVIAVSDFSVDGGNVYARWGGLATLSVAARLNGQPQTRLEPTTVSTTKAIAAATFALHQRIEEVDRYLTNPLGFTFSTTPRIGARTFASPDELFGLSGESDAPDKWATASNAIVLALSWAPAQILGFQGSEAYDPSENYVFAATPPTNQSDFRLPVNTNFRGANEVEYEQLSDPEFDVSSLTELRATFQSGSSFSSFPVARAIRPAAQFASQGLSKARGSRQLALSRASALLASVARNSASQGPDASSLIPPQIRPFVQDRQNFVDSVYGGILPESSPQAFSTAPAPSFAAGFVEPTSQLQPSRPQDRLIYYRQVLSSPDIRFEAGDRWIESDKNRYGDLAALNSTLLGVCSSVDSLRPLSTSIADHIEMVAMEATSLLGIVRRREELQGEIEESITDAEAAQRREDQRVIEANQMLEFIESSLQASEDRLRSSWTPVVDKWISDFSRSRGFSPTIELVRRQGGRLAPEQGIANEINEACQEYWRWFGGDRAWADTNIRVDVQTPLDGERENFGSMSGARIGSDRAEDFIRVFKDFKSLYGNLQRADAEVAERTRILAEARASSSAIQSERDRNVEAIEGALRRTLLTLLEERGQSDLAARRGKSALISQIIYGRIVDQIQRGSTRLLEQVSAWTYTLWCNGDRLMNVPLGGLTESGTTLSDQIQRSVVAGASTLTPSSFARLLENTAASVVPVIFSEFQPNFLEVSPDMDPMRHIMEVNDPFFSNLLSKRSLLVDGSSRWLGVDQATLWTLALYVSALAAVESEASAQQDIYSSTGPMTTVVTDGNRVALRVPVARLTSLLTRKTLPEQRMIVEVARPMDEYIRAINLFYGGIQEHKRRLFRPLTNFLEGVSSADPVDLDSPLPSDGPFGVNSTPEKVIRASWQVSGGAGHAISRFEAIGRLIESEVLSVQAISEGLSFGQSDRPQTRFRRQSSFAVLRNPASESTGSDQPAFQESTTMATNNPRESLFLRGLDLLLREVGFGSIDPQNAPAQEISGAIDTDKVIVVGSPRDYTFWKEAPSFRVGLDWTSILNLTAMSVNSVYDSGLWVSPKSPNYLWQTLPHAQLPTALNGLGRGLLDHWWDFWCFSGGSVKKMTYRQAIERYAPADTPSVFRVPALAFAKAVIVNHVLSESLRLWMLASWSTDFNEWALKGAPARPSADVVALLASGYSESAFSRVWLLPWSKSFSENGRAQFQFTENLRRIGSLRGVDVTEMALQERASAVTISEIETSIASGSLRGYYQRPGNAFTGSLTRLGS